MTKDNKGYYVPWQDRMSKDLKKDFGQPVLKTQKDYDNYIVENTSKPARDETVDETVERYMWLYEDGDKPKHYDDPYIRKIDTMARLPIVNRNIEQKISGNKTLNYINDKNYQYGGQPKKRPLPTGKKILPEERRKQNLNKAWGLKNQPKKFRVGPPNPFSHHDVCTYPSSGPPQAQLSTWDLLKATAKTPEEKKEIRDTIRSSYKNGSSFIAPDELRMIGKHPDQLKALETPEVKHIEPMILPSLRVTPVSTPEETISLDQRLRNTKVAPGLSPELLGLQKQINRNVDYVLGADQKEEREEKTTTSNKEEETHG